MLATSYTSEEYITGWLMYGVGALLFFVAWWLLTAKLKNKELRHIARIMVFAIFAMPWTVSVDLPYLAPAWLVVVLETFFDGGQAFFRAGIPLLVAVVAALSASLLLRLTVGRVLKSKS